MSGRPELYMPPEWAPHARTWMAWPVAAYVLADDPETAGQAWASVANAISEFEPVTILVPEGEAEAARRALYPGVRTLECPIADSWVRDSGPTFVLRPHGGLAAIDWTFNGWGGRTFPEGVADALVARRIAEDAGAERIVSHLVNEGGGIHVDGEGTLLLTESVQLNPNRNPNWTRAEVEAELHRCLGTRHAIWLPRGLASDSDATGTDGHIDTLACFVRPGLMLAHGQPDPDHPDYETARENAEILRKSRDAKGREIEVIVVDAPAPRERGGAPLSLTYVNFSFVNGGVVLPVFDDPRDEEVVALLTRLLPERRIVPVSAPRIFQGGGGVHCITQQEPATGGTV
jgi:agmatine deiminase